MIHSPLSQWINSTLAIAYPERCQLCEQHFASASRGYVCRACQKLLRRTKPPWCPQCGLPVDSSQSSNSACLNCREANWQFHQARSVFTAQGPMREIIHRYKYDQHEFFEPFLRHCCRQGAALTQTTYTALIPIPLHPTKERERGFNQANRLAEFFGELFELPIKTNLLKRVRFTETQTHLPRNQRLRNVMGSFHCPTSISRNRFLLVDDVMTTGATASAAAHALRKSGARLVDVLTLARALPF